MAEGDVEKCTAAEQAEPLINNKGGENGGVSIEENKNETTTTSNTSLFLVKYGSFCLLVTQMVGMVMLMRYSRTHHPPNTPMYLASTAVFVMEVMKFSISCMMITIQTKCRLFETLNQHIIQSPFEVLKLSVPSFLYTVQNNLLYLILSNLDAPTYQVCSQLKILTTAVCSACWLQKKFSMAQWIALFILTVGVALVEYSGAKDKESGQAADVQQNRLVGFIAVVMACLTSGFSGVYFEKILKGSQTSLWIRNCQMYLSSIVIALITVYVKDGVTVAEHGFLGGYHSLVWGVILVQAVGGILVSVVVKYLDNVVKVFATSFSIIITCLVSAMFFDFQPTGIFAAGVGCVIIATIMYATKKRKQDK